MEQSNKTQRSEVWEQIYKVVSKIPRKDVESDAADAPSVATELEELFLKLLPIHDVSNRSEQFFCCVVENGQEKCNVQCHFCKDWVEDAEEQKNCV